MPLSVDKIIRRAKRHISKGETALAVPLYQQVLETYPQNKRAIAGLKSLQKNTKIEATTRKAPPEDQQRALKYLVALSEQGQQQDQTRQLLECLGLDWEDQCLDFHKTSRVVRSASAQQVRQKMYPGSSEEWRKYEKHLGPMLDALDDV